MSRQAYGHCGIRKGCGEDVVVHRIGGRGEVHVEVNRSRARTL